MGLQTFDQFTYLHFAAGIVAYYWGIPFILWVGILFLRGRFWCADQRLETVSKVSKLEVWPEVVCVIPARNEAQTIANTVASLTDQDYPGIINVIVVDDNSNDGTALAAGESDQLWKISGKPLKEGWSGWAQIQNHLLIDLFFDHYLLAAISDIGF